MHAHPTTKRSRGQNLQAASTGVQLSIAPFPCQAGNRTWRLLRIGNMTCDPGAPAMASDVTAIVTCMTDAERPFIKEALQSIQDQTVLPRETLIVVLESNTWIEPVVAEFPNMKVIRRPPGWEGAARHTAIDVAQTEFVAFLDGDDAWVPTKTRKQLEYMRGGRWDIVGADYTLTTEEGRLFAY